MRWGGGARSAAHLRVNCRGRPGSTREGSGVRASCGGSIVMSGRSRSSQRGMYHDFSPISVRNAGTSVIRTTSASVGQDRDGEQIPNSFEIRRR